MCIRDSPRSSTPLDSFLLPTLPPQESINTITHWGVLMWVVALCALCAGAYAVGLHCRLAREQKGRAAQAAFFASRLVVLGACAALAVLLEAFSDYRAMHVHHYFLGWAVGLFAEFNNPASAMTLAIAQGIFVQGACAGG